MKIKTILITGFDPFGGEKTNPSFEAIKSLPDFIEDTKIIKKEIPTQFFKSKEVMLSLIKEFNPEIIINVGQAGGRDSISIEKQAFNLIQSSIPDNANNQPNNIKICENSDEILLSNLPIYEMEKALKENNIPCIISKDAGRYVCNYIMYSMLLENKKSTIKSGFIHVPYSKDQIKNKKEGTPYMEISEMSKALYICLETIIKIATK